MTGRFPDVESELMAWLDREFVLSAPASTSTPASWPSGAFSVVRVGLLGGTDDGLTDYSRVDIEVFSDRHSTMRGLAEDIRQGLAPRVRLGSATIDSVRTDAVPHEVPWQGASVRRSLATYQIAFRR